jgi:predicted O-methyltransferase YrrM
MVLFNILNIYNENNIYIIRLYLEYAIFNILYMLTNFVGPHYRLADNWLNHVDLNYYNDKKINYLEIGTFYGANILSVANTYGLHNDSKLYCIDPWEDYIDYPEYKDQQSTIYNTFISNVEESGVKNKIIINRGFSNVEIPKFQDDFFDIIYIDGNHEPEYVLEDAVLSFRKLKKNGIMIFDDYGWGGPDLTKRGIDGFLSGYHKKIIILGQQNTQVFVKKI